MTTNGPIIGIFNQYAFYEGGKSIHAPIQLTAFGQTVDDTPKSQGGKLMIKTVEGHVIPLKIKDGLPYMNMVKPTLYEMDDYPHVIFTSDIEWDPTELDDDWDPAMQEEFTSNIEEPPELPNFVDDDDGKYEEEFTKHELNVYKCFLKATKDHS